LRAALIAEEPVALLKGDFANWSADDRKALVKSLLDAVESKKVTDGPYSNAEAYAKLSHLDLGAELRPFITKGGLSATTRRLAILIAEKCKLTELQPELLHIALDAADHPQVRSGAVSALKRCGDASVPDLIRPLAAGQVGPDPNNDIKGAALDLLWPDYMTATELFSLLSPAADNYFGSYAIFQVTLPETLRAGDFLPALEWATQLIVQSGPIGGFRQKSLADAIMFKVWPLFDQPELTQPFLDHIAVRLRQNGDLCRGSDHDEQATFVDAIRSDSARRREFLLALCARSIDQFESFTYRRVGLLQETDLAWLLSIAPGSSTPVAGLRPETLCDLIDCAFVAGDDAHFGALYDATGRWPELRARYAYLLDGVRLDSPDAVQARARHEQLRALENDRPPPIAANPAAQVVARLDEAEGGRWQAWWQMTCYLTLTPESRGLGDECDYFITAMPGWGEANEAFRCRIVAGAERYLAEAVTNIDDWLGCEPMPIYRNDIAGLRALILLKQVSSEGYERIADATWRKWAPVIVGLPRRTVVHNSPEIAQILNDALDRAPSEFVAAVRTIIQLERERMRAAGTAPVGSPFSILNDLNGCWRSILLQDAILDELRNPDNTPAEYAAFLDALLQAGVESALDHALALLTNPESPKRTRNLAIAEVLLRGAAVRSWPTLWRAMESDDDFARELLRAVSRIGFDKAFYSGIGEREVAALYELMVRLFPRKEEATDFVGAWDGVEFLRDSIPRYLADLGTEAAVVALSELTAGHPELSHLAYYLALAERTMRIVTWLPLSPKEILALADRPSLKLITNPADLCEVLIGTLEKYAAGLHGRQTPVRDLWDRQGGKDIFRPIDEPALSDVITRLLQNELGSTGVFANREVEVSRVPGAPVGQRTDILVNAVRRRPGGQPFDPIAAVIETKGCWNNELFTGLEAQLFRDYMIPMRAETGIYLVAWFDREKWDPEDSRRDKVPRVTIIEVMKALEHQAASIPRGFIVRPVILECRIPETATKASRKSPSRSSPRGKTKKIDADKERGGLSTKSSARPKKLRSSEVGKNSLTRSSPPAQTKKTRRSKIRKGSPAKLAPSTRSEKIKARRAGKKPSSRLTRRAGSKKIKGSKGRRN
jgi:hypothetical protein